MGLLKPLLAAGLLAEVAKVAIPGARVRALFERIGHEEGVDADVLHAIAWQESGVNPEAARGADSEIGMMQVIPGKVRGRPPGIEFAARELGTPEGNVRAAARLWQAHVALIGASVADGLSAYNAGLSDQRRVRRTAAGGYVNERYVFDAIAKYAALKVASVAPSNLIRRV